ncbi:hypothetical protein [Streptomyces sp. NBC_01334]|uniref:hypothetical protein n=1 Tax=Streptomyces sp. NBC_01334 TaxID=2903827 RepID=UPI002E133487|nr:hypothetical protein OG736_42630 [Streptomyces sp. NBC_01334]
MRKPKPRTALISLAAAITVSAVATTVLESSAFPARDDPKAREAYEQGYEWVKTRTEAEPDPTTRLNPTPTPSPSLVTEMQRDTVTLSARSVGELGEVDDREICDYYASVSEYTSGLPAKYRDDWVRGCQAAMTPQSDSGPRPSGR